MSDLSRTKAELESRVEEDQFELEELLEKQRSHISQVASIQSQLTESNYQVEEMIEAKASLESKVRELIYPQGSKSSRLWFCCIGGVLTEQDLRAGGRAQ